MRKIPGWFLLLLNDLWMIIIQFLLFESALSEVFLRYFGGISEVFSYPRFKPPLQLLQPVAFLDTHLFISQDVTQQPLYLFQVGVEEALQES